MNDCFICSGLFMKNGRDNYVCPKCLDRIITEGRKAVEKSKKRKETLTKEKNV